MTLLQEQLEIVILRSAYRLYQLSHKSQSYHTAGHRPYRELASKPGDPTTQNAWQK